MDVDVIGDADDSYVLCDTCWEVGDAYVVCDYVSWEVGDAYIVCDDFFETGEVGDDKELDVSLSYSLFFDMYSFDNTTVSGVDGDDDNGDDWDDG